MERKCWVNFQCRGVLLVWMMVGQGPITLAVGAGGVCLDIFSLIYLFFFLSPSLWETARYRLKYCLKGPLNPKQPTNQHPKWLTSTLCTYMHFCQYLTTVLLESADGETKVCGPTGYRALDFWLLSQTRLTRSINVPKLELQAPVIYI